MPVNSLPSASKVQIGFQTGTDANGNAIVRNRTFGNLKPTATDAQVYAYADSIGGLQKHVVAAVRRTDTEELINSL